MSLSAHRVSTGQCTGKSRLVSPSGRGAESSSWLYSTMLEIRGAVLEQIGSPRPYARVPADHHRRPRRWPRPVPTSCWCASRPPGVCHSDLSVVDGNRVRPTPMLLGHEAAGIIERVGDGVNDVAVGQRVVMTFLPRCGHCAACVTDGLTPCKPGSAANNAGTLLGGGMRLAAATRPVLHHLGVSASRRTPSSTAPASCRWPTMSPRGRCAARLRDAHRRRRGAQRRPATPGQTVAIVGLGGVGMAAVMTALSYAGVHVIAVDQLPDKLAGASTLGAHEVYTPQEAVDAGQGGRGGRGRRPSRRVGDGHRAHRRGRPDHHCRPAAAGCTDQCVPVGFCGRRPVADRQLPGVGGAGPRHPAVRGAVAIRPAAGGVAGVLDDRPGRHQRRDGSTRRRPRRAPADLVRRRPKAP